MHCGDCNHEGGPHVEWQARGARRTRCRDCRECKQLEAEEQAERERNGAV